MCELQIGTYQNLGMLEEFSETQLGNFKSWEEKKESGVLEKTIFVAEKSFSVRPLLETKYLNIPSSSKDWRISRKMHEKIKGKNLEHKVDSLKKEKTLDKIEEELISPWQFVKRMGLIFYASFYVPIKYGFIDAEIDYETGKITPIYENKTE